VLVPIAKILGTHGLKGEVKTLPFLLNVDLFLNIKTFYLDKNKTEILEVESIRKGPGDEIYLLKFKDVDYESARFLRNRILYAEIKDLPPLEDDEFYYYQIYEFEVKDKKGKSWGRVKEVIPLGEYELLLVKGKESFYLPLIEEFVEEMDFKAQTILVKEIDDLVEVQKSKK
jgi:16S rRNA processing protein RimM